MVIDTKSKINVRSADDCAISRLQGIYLNLDIKGHFAEDELNKIHQLHFIVYAESDIKQTTER